MSLIHKPINLQGKINKFIIKSKSKYSRLQAYDICHEKFINAINKTCTFSDDDLALHLYAFLASYGMVCRKSILLQHNYKLLIDVVKIVRDAKYKSLLDVDIFNPLFNQKKYIDLVLELKTEIATALKISAKSNDTLTSKIIMGTLGCVPAYDRHVCESLRNLRMCKSFSEKGLQHLIRFAQSHKTDILNIQTLCAASGMNYSIMKLLDCVLWI